MMIIIEKLFDAAELAAMRGHLAKGNWQDGRNTAGGAARLAKNNLQLEEGTEPALSLGQQIVDRLWANPLFISGALPRKIYPPRFNRYGLGQTYGAHVDSALMRAQGQMIRTDLSATLFLSAPDEYDGGELEIEGGFGAQAVKLNAGDLLLYPATSLHRVAPVTRGERLASFFWIESLVASGEARATLFDLDQSIQRLTARLGPDDAEIVGLSALYHNLLRNWATT